jgi:hypothetical protein
MYVKSGIDALDEMPWSKRPYTTKFPAILASEISWPTQEIFE